MRGKTGGWVVWVRHARLKIDARLQRRPRDHRRHGHRQRHRQVHGHGQRVRLGRSVLFAARHQQRDVLDRPAWARVWSGARGDHRQRSAGRRTRKNARARRNGDRVSRAIPARQERARAGARLGRALARPSGPSGGGGTCGGRRGGERQPAPRARPCPAPRDSHSRLRGFSRDNESFCLLSRALTSNSNTVGGLPPLDLHLVKGASAFAPALLSAETAAPHRAARLRHGARGDLPVRRQL